MKIFILISVLLMPLISNAFPWDKQKIFSCNSYEDSLNCNQKCVITSQEIEYKVNEKNNVIKMVLFESGKSIDTQTFDNCMLVDEKNWNCSKIIFKDGIKVDHQMTNGIISIKEFNPIGMKSLYKCAKYK